MSIDVKRNLDIMRATVAIVEVVAPFDPRERLSILAAAVVMAGCKEILYEEATRDVVGDILGKMRSPKP